MKDKDDEDEHEKHLRHIHLIATYGPWFVVLVSALAVTIMILMVYFGY